MRLPLLRIRIVLLSMNPEDTTEILRGKGKLGPVSASLSVPLVCRGASERETHTDDETGDGKQDGIDTD